MPPDQQHNRNETTPAIDMPPLYRSKYTRSAVDVPPDPQCNRGKTRRAIDLLSPYRGKNTKPLVIYLQHLIIEIYHL